MSDDCKHCDEGRTFDYGEMLKNHESRWKQYELNIKWNKRNLPREYVPIPRDGSGPMENNAMQTEYRNGDTRPGEDGSIYEWTDGKWCVWGTATYGIRWNRVRPFEVFDDQENESIVVRSGGEICYVCDRFQKRWIGYHWDAWSEGGINRDISMKDINGNSFLIKISKHEYVWIGQESVSTFRTTDEIVDYMSPVGRSDVPVCVAYGTEYVYMLTFGVKCRHECFESSLHPFGVESVVREYTTLSSYGSSLSDSSLPVDMVFIVAVGGNCRGDRQVWRDEIQSIECEMNDMGCELDEIKLKAVKYCRIVSNAVDDVEKMKKYLFCDDYKSGKADEEGGAKMIDRLYRARSERDSMREVIQRNRIKVGAMVRLEKKLEATKVRLRRIAEGMFELVKEDDDQLVKDWILCTVGDLNESREGALSSLSPSS